MHEHLLPICMHAWVAWLGCTSYPVAFTWPFHFTAGYTCCEVVEKLGNTHYKDHPSPTPGKLACRSCWRPWQQPAKSCQLALTALQVGGLARCNIRSGTLGTGEISTAQLSKAVSVCNVSFKVSLLGNDAVGPACRQGAALRTALNRHDGRAPAAICLCWLLFA